MVIAIVNQKGGVGKTTTAMNVASYLAHDGRSVLLIDLDPQANATSGLGFNPSSLEKGTYDVLIGSVDPGSAVARSNEHPLPLMGASVSLAGAAIELVDVDNREYQLERAIAPLRLNYDYIFIDCPPSLDLLTINGLVASDFVLIPVQAEYFALEGIGQLMETITLVKERLKPSIEILGAVITMYDKRARLSDNVLQELYRHFPQNIFRTVIPRSIRLAEAPSHGKSIARYDASSRGGKAYERLTREIISVLSPLNANSSHDL